MATKILKRVTESTLCGMGATRILRRLLPRTSILAYHNVVPDREPAFGDRSLHLVEREFVAQLDLLQKTHDVVPLDRLLTPGREAKRPRVAITFDDAYAGAVEIAVRALAERQLPATIFVVPALTGGYTFWWDAIAGYDSGGVTSDLRRFALDELRGDDGAVRAWAREHGIRLHTSPPHAVTATVDQLRRALSTGSGITLAAHTWSHPNLARVSAERLEDELVRPRAWLQERFDPERVLAWLSYPYGRHSPQVERAVARAGYLGALRVDGGTLAPGTLDTMRYGLPRLNVPSGVSLRGLEIRMAGLVRR